MTDEQINTAIAEACGWVDRGSFNYDRHYDRPDDHLFRRLKPNSEEYEYRWQHEFNYCNDLNAMHEAEKVLTQEQITDYVIEVMQFSHEPMLSTARQRAEAFLRTLGKWEEVQK